MGSSTIKVQHSNSIDGLLTIEPQIFRDARGTYMCAYSAKDYVFESAGKRIEFLEDDFSVSKKNVLRGLHGDHKTWKLIQCVAGEVFFAVVDVRKSSPTYLSVQTFILNEASQHQVLVPAGCANGQLCLSERSVIYYKQSEVYMDSSSQFTIAWNDPKFKIPWPVSNPLLSERDGKAGVF